MWGMRWKMLAICVACSLKTEIAGWMPVYYDIITDGYGPIGRWLR